MSENGTKLIDHSPLKINQATIIVLLGLSFILDTPWLVGFVAIVMVLGSILGVPGFGIINSWVLRPLGWIQPDVYADHPEPHRFAQAIGGIFAAISSVSLFSGLILTGWIFSWIVIILAGVNLLLGFCAGCAMYYWFNRLHIPGFYKSSLPNTTPGARPRRKDS
jgi:hypothetical protein